MAKSNTSRADRNIDYCGELAATIAQSAIAKSRNAKSAKKEKQPTPDDLELLRAIDRKIDATRLDIHAVLAQVEPLALSDRLFAHTESYVAFEWTSFGKLPLRPVNDVAAEHTRRMNLLADIFKNTHGAYFEDGGVKSRHRVVQKTSALQKTKKYTNIPDRSRGRVIADTLTDLDHAYNDLTVGMTNAQFFEIGFRTVNYPTPVVLALPDADRPRTNYATPIRILFSYWAPMVSHASFKDRMITEVQLVTKRTRALMDISHPFEVSKTVKYPSEAHKKWLHEMFYKAALADALAT